MGSGEMGRRCRLFDEIEVESVSLFSICLSHGTCHTLLITFSQNLIGVFMVDISRFMYHVLSCWHFKMTLISPVEVLHQLYI